MRIHQQFTGGNIRVVKEDGGYIYLENELRDTLGDWFYWAFCVEGAEGMTLTFHFQNNRVGYFGPAVSHDLTSWTWLDQCEGESFTYTFGKEEHKTYFAHHMLYHPARMDAFVKAHGIEAKTLCRSQKGREVPYFTLGNGKIHILLTARHHACESTGSYVLEGVVEELAKHPIPNTTIFCVPFVDYDGVVDGDQGKGRAPYDHNRDYDPKVAPIYPTTAAIRAYAETHGCHYGFDFHSPWHKGENNDQVFIVQNSFEKLDILTAFGKAFENAITPDAMAYEQANDFPFKKDWNQPVPCFGAEMTKRGENVVAFSLETAYFGTPDNRVSQEGLVALGRCFARALTNFIAEQK